MDPKPFLKRIVSEVSWALTKFAESKQWQKSDYWIYYYVNSEWDYVNFVFVSRRFDNEDKKAAFSQVWQYLTDYFKDAPEVLRPVTIIVRGKAQADRGGLYSIGSAYQEFWSFGPVSHPY